MKKSYCLLLTLLALLAILPAQANDKNDKQQTYSLRQKGVRWTIQADRIELKGAIIYFRGNVKATSSKGEKILADTAEACQTPGKEKLTLSPVKTGTIIKTSD